jgi:hypothetical protein
VTFRLRVLTIIVIQISVHVPSVRPYQGLLLQLHV